MSAILSLIIEALILVAALSIDAFVASFAYGTNKIKIPTVSIIVINLICTGTLLIFLCVGKVVSPLLPEQLIKFVCFTILFLLGIAKLFDSSIKLAIRKLKNLTRHLHFSLFHIKFILTIYADPQKADVDNSELLSPKEAASLGIALSLDSAAVGFGAGVMVTNMWVTILLSFITGLAAVIIGSFLGNKIAQKTSLDLSWLSGVLLIILAFMKLF